MRIIAGALGGRILKTVEGSGYRPATGKVREALFSMLSSLGIVWGSVRVLDLFAGSGSLSFEALSRGAQEACLVEKAPLAVKCLEKNKQTLGLDYQCQVASMDVTRFLRGRVHQPYDIIFIDPPYGENRLAPTLQAVLRGGWLAPGGYIIAEIESRLRFNPEVHKEDISLEIDRLYGQTRILLWNKPLNA